VDAWPTIPKDLDRELVARLIGTTHGHGRSWFPHNSRELLNSSDTTDAQEIAATLFDEGDWDELIEHTQQHYGVWGCAYLEAILRAADGQISAEGR
jgi:CRISPR-associated endonuclease/helicase Cas3